MLFKILYKWISNLSIDLKYKIFKSFIELEKNIYCKSM